jgi:hypothetical protein
MISFGSAFAQSVLSGDFCPASAGRAMRECLARLKKYAGYTTTNSAPI